MQKEIQLTDKTLLVVSVPKGASDLTLPKVGIADLYFRTDDKEYEDGYISVGIPTGYELLGIYPELTEEKCKMVIELHSITRVQQFGYKDYLKSTEKIDHFTCKTALESFQSLMEREKITGYDKYAILIKSK